MANRWYVRQDGQELGPFSDAGLRRFLDSGQARPGVLIRNGSTGEWLAPVQAGMAGTLSAAPAAAAVSPSKAPGGKPIDVIAPNESLLPTAGQTPFWSRPATWVAAGAGFVTLLSAACVGAWLLARHLDAERQTAAAPKSASPAANPSVANLEQETKRLREELADLQGRLREREPPAPKPEPAPPAFELDGERAALAKEIALEMARQEDLQERFNYETGLQVDAAAAGVDLPPYRSLRDERYVVHLPAVELELSKLDRQGLAARRAAFEQAESNRAKRIQQLQSQIREAVAALDVDLARQTLKQYLPLVDGDEYDRGVKLLRQLGGARVERLLEYVRAIPDDARQSLADKGPPPAELMRRFNDQELRRAVQNHLPQLSSLVISERKNIEWNRLQDQIRVEGNLTLMRKWRFLHQAFLLKQQGELTPASAAEFVETFGVFRLEGETSLADGALTAFLQADEAQPPFEMYKAYCEGAILRVPLTRRLR